MYDAFSPNAFLLMPVILLFFFLTAALKRAIVWWPDISFFSKHLLLLLLLVLSLLVVFWFCALYSFPVSVWLSFVYFLKSQCCSCYAVVDLHMWQRTSSHRNKLEFNVESQVAVKVKTMRSWIGILRVTVIFGGVFWGCLSECWGLLLGYTCLNIPLPLLYSSAGWNTYCVEMLYIFKLV